jgi:hypothetical protein
MSKMGFNEPALSVEYQGAQKGWATVGGKTCYFKSKLERRWAEYLEMLKGLGEITDWLYEPQKFEFEGIRSGTVFYTPDFKVTQPLMWEYGIILYHEVKGHLTQKDVTKFRRMAKYHPGETIILVIQQITKKNYLRVENAKKYVAGVIEAEKILRKVGL